jgi:hypothetical protein
MRRNHKRDHEMAQSTAQVLHLQAFFRKPVIFDSCQRFSTTRTVLSSNDITDS